MLFQSDQISLIWKTQETADAADVGDWHMLWTICMIR